MIQAAWRRSVAFIVSAPLVVGLLAFVGVWSLLATLVAQGPISSHEITAWAAAHPAAESVVRVFGLHHAFTSYLFLAAVGLLSVSTVICSWRRTKVALRRMRVLRDAARADASAIAEKHDIEIVCDAALNDAEVLSIASATLGELGIRTSNRDGALRAVSAPWTVWGSAVFHWALVLLIATVLGGQLMRSEGSISLAVGESKPNARGSYTDLHSGLLHGWSGEHRSVRLDGLEPDYNLGGIDRGAVPTVALLDGAGKVLVRQRIYQNKMLHDGSLAINAPGLGLAVTLAFLDSYGTEVDRSVQYVDFSQATTGGTVPVSAIQNRDPSGRVRMTMYATVPLEGTLGHYNEWIPKSPRARVRIASPTGATLFSGSAAPGKIMDLPGGSKLKVVGIDWYSRLSLVDDPTIPLIYAAMVIATIGLTITVSFRQQLLAATVVRDSDGAKLALRMRLWRGVPTNANEIHSELAQALEINEKESTS